MLRFALLAAVAATPSLAWNHVGHKAIAGLAYDHLTPQVRARVDALIRRHPDYVMLTEGGPAGDEAKLARYAFMKAAYWPDMIKGDPRFYDSYRGAPTPTLAGFPDMERRQNWHYINVPFSMDGTEPEPMPAPNVLTQLRVVMKAMGNEPGEGLGANEDPVYLLPWLLHLAGDVHQPLHCSSRWKKGQVDQQGKLINDRGGNSVFVKEDYNLHAYWDNALGITDTPAYIDGVVAFLGRVQRDQPLDLDPEKWVDEGFRAARDAVYTFGNESGTKEKPIVLGEAYALKAKRVARERAALAGYRIATFLNQQLK